MKLKEEDKQLLETIFQKKKDDKSRKITSKEFEEFKKRVYYRQKYLGLMDVTIYVDMKSLNGFAQTSVTDTGQNAYITLNDEVKENDEVGYNIDDNALHEVLEVMLRDLRSKAEDKYSRDEIDIIIHRIIARFVNLFVYKR